MKRFNCRFISVVDLLLTCTHKHTRKRTQMQFCSGRWCRGRDAGTDEEEGTTSTGKNKNLKIWCSLNNAAPISVNFSLIKPCFLHLPCSWRQTPFQTLFLEPFRQMRFFYFTWWGTSAFAVIRQWFCSCLCCGEWRVQPVGGQAGAIC